MSSAINKLAQSQSTLGSRIKESTASRGNPKDGQSALKNPFKQTLPLKFPRNHIVKPCDRTMLDQTRQDRHVSSVRNFTEHNRSRFFEGSPFPLTQSQIISRHPQYLFDTYHQRKISKSGLFGHLSRESLEYPIRLRTFEDIGTTNNGKKIFQNLHYHPDPIITPTEQRQYNSTLERTWREPRRHRDNGIECQKVIHQAVKIQKREPYRVTSSRGNTGTSYKEVYLRARGLLK